MTPRAIFVPILRLGIGISSFVGVLAVGCGKSAVTDAPGAADVAEAAEKGDSERTRMPHANIRVAVMANGFEFETWNVKAGKSYKSVPHKPYWISSLGQVVEAPGPLARHVYPLR